MAHANKNLGCIDHAKMNSLNLIENLGEVEYLMSDKTGTLTKNDLTLVAVCCSANISFMKDQSVTLNPDTKEPETS